jgi:hypothetical protein
LKDGKKEGGSPLFFYVVGVEKRGWGLQNAFCTPVSPLVFTGVCKKVKRMLQKRVDRGGGRR